MKLREYLMQKTFSKTYYFKTVKIQWQRILKAARGKKKTVTYKGTPIRQSADFSSETTGQETVEWHIQSIEW